MANGEVGLEAWPAHVSGAAPGIGRRAAQRLARQELSKALYHPHQSFGQWLLSTVRSLLTRLFSAGNSALPGGWWALAALAAVAVLIVAVIMARVGPVARSRRAAAGALSGGTLLTARERRERAERSAAAGDYSAAIIESLRAIAAGLEERGVLVPDAGRTADELAGEAGRLMPAHADNLAAAARLFDDVCYGGQRGIRDGYERLRDLGAAVGAATPHRAACGYRRDGHPHRDGRPGRPSPGDGARDSRRASGGNSGGDSGRR